MVNDPEFLAAMQACGAVQFGAFTLASGKTSDYYVDIKRVTRPELLREIARRMAPHVRGYDRIAGVELGAVPIAVAVALETGLPFLIVRKEPKEHGTKRAHEGELRVGDRVVFVEDVVTTAGTLQRAVEGLRAAGAVVDRAVAVVDREEGGADHLAAAGVQLLSLLRARDLRTVGPTSK
ncbi:MAG TPA: orotate phosphoribosyltransferase [Thermoplasmata archaeon]|nr:orotate phosphoribosyltransferase [Thermoplasmata archaeon]